MRITRVSPPELARLLPGPYASSIVTAWPDRARRYAIHAPKHPAPTTMTGSMVDILHRPARRAVRREAALMRGPGGVRFSSGRPTRSLTERQYRVELHHDHHATIASSKSAASSSGP